jgi:hypothetical protein
MIFWVATSISDLIWRRYQVFTSIAERFLAIARQEFVKMQEADH